MQIFYNFGQYNLWTCLISREGWVNLSFSRLPFLDRARGLIMIFMALDHTLFFWSVGRINNEGLPRLVNGIVSYNPIVSSNILALIVMLSANICAPGFLFIAGYVLASSIKKRQANGQSSSSIDRLLGRRALTLIAFQLFIASPAFYLPTIVQAHSLTIVTLGTFLSLSVLSTIGFCFLIFTLGRHISPWTLAGISGFFYLLSQLSLPFLTTIFPDIQTLLQVFETIFILPIPFSAERLVNNNFPLIPWFLPMSLGWLYGATYAKHRGIAYEAKRFAKTGIFSLTLFLILRLLKTGDYLPSNGTFHGFMGLSKYPPSLDYMLLNLGLLFIMFFLLDKLPKLSKIGRILENFGQAPLLFYNAHLWLYAAIPAILQNFNGYSLKQGIGIWLIGLFILSPLCRFYLARQSSARIPKRKVEFTHGTMPVKHKEKALLYPYGKD